MLYYIYLYLYEYMKIYLLTNIRWGNWRRIVNNCVRLYTRTIYFRNNNIFPQYIFFSTVNDFITGNVDSWNSSHRQIASNRYKNSVFFYWFFSTECHFFFSKLAFGAVFSVETLLQVALGSWSLVINQIQISCFLPFSLYYV